MIDKGTVTEKWCLVDEGAMTGKRHIVDEDTVPVKRYCAEICTRLEMPARVLYAR